MSRQNQALTELLAPVVTAMGYEMLGLVHWDAGRGGILRLYIDCEDGVNLQDCERVSRQVSSVLDAHDPIAGAYRLEVSSPGLDRPLFTLAHFARFVGHRARTRTRRGIDGRRRFTGLIRAVEEDQVRVQADGVEYAIPGKSIEWARLVPEV